MSSERKKVLEMVAQGKISSEDAERLLDKLSGSAENKETPAAETKGDSASSTRRPRFLRIKVNSPDRDQVNIRVPIGFARSGMALMGVLPPHVRERLAEKGIDLDAFTGQQGRQLIEDLQDLHFDVEGRDGKTVRIYCE